jgi:hypothetical protein
MTIDAGKRPSLCLDASAMIVPARVAKRQMCNFCFNLRLAAKLLAFRVIPRNQQNPLPSITMNAWI